MVEANLVMDCFTLDCKGKNKNMLYFQALKPMNDKDYN